MKKTCCLGIEPAENGWIVVETTFFEEDSEETESVEHSAYDPSSAFSEAGEEKHSCLRKTERVHVFTDHLKLMSFVSERTKLRAT